MDKVNKLLADYQVVVAEMLKIRKEASEKLKESLSEVFKQFFVETPEIACVTWTQYTPYFNDGDTCEFSVHDKYFITKAAIAEDYEEGDYPTGWSADEYGTYISTYGKDRDIENFRESYGDRAEIIWENCLQMKEILDSIPDEIYLDAFEDHSSILVTPDGIEVEDADHD